MDSINIHHSSGWILVQLAPSPGVIDVPPVSIFHLDRCSMTWSNKRTIDSQIIPLIIGMEKIESPLRKVLIQLIMNVMDFNTVSNLSDSYLCGSGYTDMVVVMIEREGRMEQIIKWFPVNYGLAFDNIHFLFWSRGLENHDFNGFITKRHSVFVDFSYENLPWKSASILFSLVAKVGSE